MAFAKSPPKHKSRTELLTASTAVQCRCCQRTRVDVTEAETTADTETDYAAAAARSTVTEAEAELNALLLLQLLLPPIMMPNVDAEGWLRARENRCHWGRKGAREQEC